MPVGFCRVFGVIESLLFVIVSTDMTLPTDRLSKITIYLLFALIQLNWDSAGDAYESMPCIEVLHRRGPNAVSCAALHVDQRS